MSPSIKPPRPYKEWRACPSKTLSDRVKEAATNLERVWTGSNLNDWDKNVGLYVAYMLHSLDNDVTVTQGTKVMHEPIMCGDVVIPYSAMSYGLTKWLLITRLVSNVMHYDVHRHGREVLDAVRIATGKHEPRAVFILDKGRREVEARRKLLRSREKRRYASAAKAAQVPPNKTFPT